MEMPKAIRIAVRPPLSRSQQPATNQRGMVPPVPHHTMRAAHQHGGAFDGLLTWKNVATRLSTWTQVPIQDPMRMGHRNTPEHLEGEL